MPAAWKTASNEAVKFDPRSRIRNLTSSNRSPRLRARLRACCTVHSPVGFAVTPPMCIRRVPCSMNTRTYSLLRSTVSTCRKSAATIPAACARRNCRQPGPERRGAGSMPAACRISHTVDGATVTPSLVSSPWIRRCPQSGFSFARRTTRRAMPGAAGGRPGLRRLLVSYLFAASLRCHASSVAGVTGKASAQRLRGTSRASAANQARPAGSYRTRPACRRRTAFSCRSTSSSASFASRAAAEHQDGQADISYFKRSYERADLQVTITGLDPEASAAAIDARLGRT